MINNKIVKNLKGFTLIELLIVIAIVAIIAAIALPSYQEQVRRSRRADAMSAVMDCASDQERRYSVRSAYADTSEALTEGLCGINSGGQLTSPEGYYTIAIATTIDAFTVTAQTTTLKGQNQDTNCNQFIITETGQKTSMDSGSAASTNCWKN